MLPGASGLGTLTRFKAEHIFNLFLLREHAQHSWYVTWLWVGAQGQDVRQAKGSGNCNYRGLPDSGWGGCLPLPCQALHICQFDQIFLVSFSFTSLYWTKITMTIYKRKNNLNNNNETKSFILSTEITCVPSSSQCPPLIILVHTHQPHKCLQ